MVKTVKGGCWVVEGWEGVYKGCGRGLIWGGQNLEVDSEGFL